MRRLFECELSLETERRIDHVCDSFEATLRRGENATFESLLAPWHGVGRRKLLQALLEIEIEYRTQSEGLPNRDEYIRRFPTEAEAITAAFTSVTDQLGVSAEPLDTTDACQGGAGTKPSQDSRTERNSTTLPGTIGRFCIRDYLGEGTCGVVYRAYDPKLEREVAIKVPKPRMLETAEHVEWFRKESLAAARLHHENICPVFEVSDVDGTPFIVMALLPGHSLSEYITREGALPERMVARVARKLANALDIAHRENILHRDLKPANIMYDAQREQPIIMDFGLARLEQSDEAHTEHGHVMGTPAYMPPEQVRGTSSEIGPRSDIYSLGIVMYEMMTARRPFKGSLGDVLDSVLNQPPAKPSEYRPHLSSELEWICLKAIAKEPIDRFASMAELAGALTSFLRESDKALHSPTANLTVEHGEGPESTTTPSRPDFPPQSEQKPARRMRHAAMWWGTAFLLSVLVLGVIVTFSTSYGLVSVEILDPSLTVQIDGNTITADDDGKPIRIHVGDHRLKVLRDGVEIQTEGSEVTISKGKTRQLRVAYVNERAFVVQSPRGPRAGSQLQLVATLTGHGDAASRTGFQASETFRADVLSVAFSPDETMIASASADRTVRLWELKTGSEIRRFEGHTSSVRSVAFSPDGKYLLSGGGDDHIEDDTIRLWNVQTGTQVCMLDGHTGTVNSVAFSSNGRLAASGGNDMNVRLWDIATAQEIMQLKGHTGPVTSVSFSPDDRVLMSSSFDLTVRLWSVSHGTQIRKLQGHTQRVWDAAFSLDGRTVITASYDTTVRLWDTESGAETQKFRGHRNCVWCVAMSPDGRLALSGASGGVKDQFRMRLWDVSTGAELAQFDEHTNWVRDVEFSRDGRNVISCASDKTIRLWSLW